ncbi:MAG: hypothetical protein EOM17_16715 [Synergistales bacterium]|nr:hypothetical protein [Synergistales bacterium]
MAVIGAGPSGLTCAGDLAKLGYAVTVYEALHEAGGVLVYNSDLVEYDGSRKDIVTIPVPASKIAMELGSDKITNIVILGSVVEASGIVDDTVCVETIKEKLGKKKPKFLPMNLDAYAKGKDVARTALSK